MNTQTEETPKLKGNLHWGELGFAGLLLAISLVTFLDALRIPASISASGISAALFPYIVSTLLALVSVAIVIQVLRGKVGEPEGGEGDIDVTKPKYLAGLLVIASVLAHGLLLDSAGYIIATTVLFIGVSLAMGARKYLQILIIAIVVAVVIYFSFTALGIYLPFGIFKGLF